MAIVWDQATMGTGVPEIDQQHRELISRLDPLLEAMKQGRSQEELKGTIAFLAEYTKFHFGHEEECMNRLRCPVAAANVTAHRHFVSVFQEIAAEAEAGGPKLALLLRAQRELSDWVRNHIMRVDTHLRQCVVAGS